MILKFCVNSNYNSNYYLLVVYLIVGGSRLQKVPVDGPKAEFSYFIGSRNSKNKVCCQWEQSGTNGKD